MITNSFQPPASDILPPSLDSWTTRGDAQVSQCLRPHYGWGADYHESDRSGPAGTIKAGQMRPARKYGWSVWWIWLDVCTSRSEACTAVLRDRSRKMASAQNFSIETWGSPAKIVNRFGEGSMDKPPSVNFELDCNSASVILNIREISSSPRRQAVSVLKSLPSCQNPGCSTSNPDFPVQAKKNLLLTSCSSGRLLKPVLPSCAHVYQRSKLAIQRNNIQTDSGTLPTFGILILICDTFLNSSWLLFSPRSKLTTCCISASVSCIVNALTRSWLNNGRGCSWLDAVDEKVIDRKRPNCGLIILDFMITTEYWYLCHIIDGRAGWEKFGQNLGRCTTCWGEKKKTTPLP